ncbi:major facilitator superfamily domain-containing protein [Stachybotrys elegans]|uniref:Major facilitator superfamily domain-containing protein n=1 Tax=Stachybotrys elegans TaxID=80388 RepID=A0A8K0WKQ1_9HYPO|nr:major facilitator superfamily domain-containing protein [Stachybotrys elegans]
MPTEQTPLIPARDHDPPKKAGRTSRAAAILSVENRVLLAGFIITLSFSFTQVPNGSPPPRLFYIFHVMTCDDFYDSHPPWTGPGDRCTRDEIAAGTAAQFSILGMTTTLCGTVNLFLAGWLVKRLGPRAVLVIQTLVPAVRVAAQILGVVAGKRTGMIIIQSTQLITIFGGPAGYILVINIIAGEIVEPLRRTAVFGKLQGCFMLGQGIGYLSGGMIGDYFGIRGPFDVAFVAFLLSALYAQLALPYLPPPASNTEQKSGKGSTGMLGPLRILVPRSLQLANGKLTKHYGLTILCLGIFFGVLATGYAPLLIQMYATAVFEFKQADNGWLMSEFAFMRSLFLIFLFPRLISAGRRWWSKDTPQPAEQDAEACPNPLTTSPSHFETLPGEQVAEEPIESPKSEHDGKDQEFDLVFLRWSLVVDGVLTAMTAFATQGWHIYLAAFFLPFGSGSAPAAKGVVTAMCSESERADALNIVTLIENVAILSTQGLFGFIFASLAEIHKPWATFFCNAALAVVAMLVLLFSNFPPSGSTIVEEAHEEDEEDDDETLFTSE